ncbi:MAG: lytic transglycosylase domain-containing protein [Brevinematia bacterium]
MDVFDFQRVLSYYNKMDFRSVVSNYYLAKDKSLLQKLDDKFYFVFANSLYKTSNFYELIGFSNLSISDSFLSNNILLLVGFGLSELRNFSNSTSIILSCISNEYLKYYSDLVEYYRFRNSIFMGNEYVPQADIARFLKQEDVDKITEILHSLSDDFAVVVSRLLQHVVKRLNLKSLVKSLVGKKYKAQSSAVLVARSLLKGGFTVEGSDLMLTLSLPPSVSKYYRSLLLLEKGQYVDAGKVVAGVLSSFKENRKDFAHYGISFDDVLVLSLRVHSRNSRDFDNGARKYLEVGGVKFLEYVLRNYKLLSRETHLKFVMNYFSKVDLSYTTKFFSSAFISYNLHEGNKDIVKEFCKFMLRRTKNSAWEKEFLLLTFLLTEENDEKLRIAREIITKYPFTYEYLAILNYSKKVTNSFLETILSKLSEEYQEIYKRYTSNTNIGDLNSLVGMKVFANHFGVKLSPDVDVWREVERFRKELVSKLVTETNTDDVEATTNHISSGNKRVQLPNYVSVLFEKGLILDAQLEVRKFFPKPDLKYLSLFERYGLIDYICRAYERMGFYRDNVYNRKAVVALAFIRELYPTPFYDKVGELSSKYGVDKSFVYAIMRQESRFSPHVLSTANAMGLMQLILPTAEAVARRFLKMEAPLSPIDVYAIDNNLELGIAHIYELYQVFGKYSEGFRDILVISSYNGGITAVRKWYDSLKVEDESIFVEGIRFHETREYTKIVLENYFIYKNFVLTRTRS